MCIATRTQARPSFVLSAGAPPCSLTSKTTAWASPILPRNHPRKFL
jgi:hypothetical protein